MHDVVDRSLSATGWLSSRCTAVVDAVACGRAAVIRDGDRGALLFFAAETASTALLGFAVRHSSGLIHAAMRSDRLDLLRIHDQPVLPSENGALGFTVAVDAVGTGTGISGRDRALTLRALASPDAVADDLKRPGHILPVRCPESARDDRFAAWDNMIGIVERAGYTPVAAACRLVHDSGDVLDDAAAYEFAATHALVVAA